MTIKDILLEEVPVTNIESWIMLGKKKSVEILLEPEDFPYLYNGNNGNIVNEDDMKRIYMRGLSSYEFNTTIYEALAIVGDDSLTEYIATNRSKNVLSIRNCPSYINQANFRRFIFELDHLLIWKATKDFHRITRMINEKKRNVPIRIEDIRSLDGILKFGIVVYYLSGYTKEVPKQIKFFREHGARENIGLAPLPTGNEDSN